MLATVVGSRILGFCCKVDIANDIRNAVVKACQARPWSTSSAIRSDGQSERAQRVHLRSSMSLLDEL